MKRQVKRFESACTELRDAASEAGNALQELARTIDVDGQAEAEAVAFSVDTAGREAADRVLQKHLGIAGFPQNTPKIPPSGEGRF